MSFSGGYQFLVPSGLRFYDTFLQLFCEKNSDGSKKLRLKGNELQQRFEDRILPADMLYVAHFLKRHPKINELDVSYNPIEDEGLMHLCQIVLKHANNIEHLNISNCDIGVDGIRALYYTSQEKKLKLKTLRLTGNKIGPQGGHLMAHTIHSIPTLEYLDLGDTDQTIFSLDSLLPLITRSSVKVLNISRPIPKSLASQVDSAFLAENLSELFRLDKVLVELHIQKCELDAHDVEILVAGLRLNETLKFLDLGYNNICCPGVEFMGEWLKNRPPLLALNIAGNSIRNHGASALSFTLPFTKIRYLDISYNRIDEKGLVQILNTIKKPYRMRHLFIWGNDIKNYDPVNKIIYRMLQSKVLEQERLDFKVYCMDGELKAARYPADSYKHKYYGVMDHGCAVELKIKRNIIDLPDDIPRALVHFKHIERYPPVEIPGIPEMGQEETD